MTRGSLSGVMVTTLAQSARDGGSVFVLGAIDSGASAGSYNAMIVWFLKQPSVCTCKYVACVFEIASIKW